MLLCLACTTLKSLKLKLPIIAYGTAAWVHVTVGPLLETLDEKLAHCVGQKSWRFLSVKVVRSVGPIIFAQKAVVQWLVPAQLLAGVHVWQR